MRENHVTKDWPLEERSGAHLGVYDGSFAAEICVPLIVARV